MATPKRPKLTLSQRAALGCLVESSNGKVSLGGRISYLVYSKASFGSLCKLGFAVQEREGFYSITEAGRVWYAEFLALEKGVRVRLTYVGECTLRNQWLGEVRFETEELLQAWFATLNAQMTLVGTHRGDQVLVNVSTDGEAMWLCENNVEPVPSA